MFRAEPLGTCSFIEEMWSFKSAKLLPLWLWGGKQRQRIIPAGWKTTERGLRIGGREQKRQTRRQTERDRHEENRIMISPDCTLLGETDSTRGRGFCLFFLGRQWSATYFSMRSNVTPGTNLALFCIQNLGKKSRQGKAADKRWKENMGCSQTRQSNNNVWPLQ